jgi:hypothetical protein
MNTRANTALKILLSTMCLVVGAQAQEEADRPVGEATGAMLRKQKAEISTMVLPSPQEWYPGKGKMVVGDASGCRFDIELVGEAKRLTLLPTELRKRVGKVAGSEPGDGGNVRVVFALNARDLPADRESMARRIETLAEHPEGYVLATTTTENSELVQVLGRSEAALWRALATLAQLFQRNGDKIELPRGEIIDYPQMEERGLLIDVGGQGFMVGPSRWSLEQWKAYVDWMVDQKLNVLWIEFIGSGRLMGNLNPEIGEWIGFSLDLKCYPQLVCRDRPIRRWDEATQKVVQDKYTAPNVEKEFVRELIDYTQARGIKCILLIGYDYFANQIPFVLGVPANDPSHREANKVYDAILREIVQRYDNAQGVCFITIENKNVPPTMVDEVIRRMHEGRAIVKAINPKMEVGVLNDYLEWRPREEFKRFSAGVPKDLWQVYSPHTQPQSKSWLRIHKQVVRYELFSQYAWNHVAYIFPERVRREVQESHINGYRRMVTQAWYADVFKLNYAVMAEVTWNSTGVPLERFWDETLARTFGPAAVPQMRAALAHTRFDIRSDIVSRMILGDYIDRPFRFWDMYAMTNIDGLKDPMLAALEEDARTSLQAAEAAVPHVTTTEGQEMLRAVISSAERRLFLATSSRHLLRALAAEKAGDKGTAIAAMRDCLTEGAKLERASTKLGIEYPMATHDDEVVARYREIMKRIEAR